MALRPILSDGLPLSWNPVREPQLHPGVWRDVSASKLVPTWPDRCRTR
jgi:hypothetical protein